VSETDIKLWEEKAKSGLLRNDRNLQRLLTDLRRSLYDAVAGIGKSPADIGLKTGSYLEKGKISLDETTLRSALTNNPEEVMRVFTKTSTATDAATKYGESGLLNRLISASLPTAQPLAWPIIRATSIPTASRSPPSPTSWLTKKMHTGANSPPWRQP